jgi:transcriptional regulator with XRE-family HTH domain
MSKTRSSGQNESRTPAEPEPTALGRYLAQIRGIKKLTLRDVEEAAEKQVSNAYLSQLEKGRISKPSPNVLHALARVYNIAYDTLMEKAGYLTAETNSDVLRKASGTRSATNALSGEQLSKEEEAKLLEYLAFLRRR